MKTKEIRPFTSEEIVSMIAENQSTLKDLIYSNATTSLEQPARIRSTKRDIARLLTILRERELGIR